MRQRDDRSKRTRDNSRRPCLTAGKRSPPRRSEKSRTVCTLDNIIRVRNETVFEILPGAETGKLRERRCQYYTCGGVGGEVRWPGRFANGPRDRKTAARGSSNIFIDIYIYIY